MAKKMSGLVGGEEYIRSGEEKSRVVKERKKRE